MQRWSHGPFLVRCFWYLFQILDLQRIWWFQGNHLEMKSGLEMGLKMGLYTPALHSRAFMVPKACKKKEKHPGKRPRDPKQCWGSGRITYDFRMMPRGRKRAQPTHTESPGRNGFWHMAMGISPASCLGTDSKMIPLKLGSKTSPEIPSWILIWGYYVL